MNISIFDQTIEYVKILVENVQCAICDKKDGSRMRYSCGHSACEDCVIDADSCMICLTPPQVTSLPPKLDDALTQRVKNASVLLKVCQDVFNTDVFQHKRLSEQLRIEKQLFPECIQAPVKYKNKRKTTFLPCKNKENRNSTFFPGEEISFPNENITMENSVTYVQQWLNKSNKDFTRKPFRDLNVNSQFDHNVVQRNNCNFQSKNDANVFNANRKRSHLKMTKKTLLDKNISHLSGNMKSIHSPHRSKLKKVKMELHPSKSDIVMNRTNTEYDNNESGIFMDNDTIVIDDSQEIEIDKDKKAWLAVLEANENETTSVVNLDCSDHNISFCSNKQNQIMSDGLGSKVKQNTKVPFYKKGYIMETCKYCHSSDNTAAAQSKEVKIIIDSVNFTTTVKILNDVECCSKFNTTNSVLVQTDICETLKKNPNVALKDSGNVQFTNLNEKDVKEDLTWQKSDTQSEDLFADEGQNINNKGGLVIEESDSDIEMEESGPLPVKVDVHRSCDQSEYGILSEIKNIQEHDNRPRRGPRGLTPTSTDSSEKENFNPNRGKKHIYKKKKSARSKFV